MVYHLHMSTKFNLIVCQPALSMSGTESTNAVYEEAIWFDGGLESLLTVP